MVWFVEEGDASGVSDGVVGGVSATSVVEFSVQ